MAQENFTKGAVELSGLLQKMLPKPRVRKKRRSTQRNAGIGRVFVVTKLPNPTFSYYFEDRIPVTAVPVHAKTLPRLEHRDLVIICRYVSLRTLIWVMWSSRRLSGIVYFVDDDLAAVVASKNVPWLRRIYVGWFGLFYLPILNWVLTHVWASTRRLAKELERSGNKVDILRPCSPLQDINTESGNNLSKSTKATAPIRIAYHSTDTHVSDHKFVLAIIEELARRRSDFVLSVFGGGPVRKIWEKASLPKNILEFAPNMAWPDYRRATGNGFADIVLCPLLDSRLNRTRSDTKRIDAARMGAAPLFSTCRVFERMREKGELHLTNNIDVWVAALDDLLDSPKKREILSELNRRITQKMRAETLGQLPGISI